MPNWLKSVGAWFREWWFVVALIVGVVLLCWWLVWLSYRSAESRCVARAEILNTETKWVYLGVWSYDCFIKYDGEWMPYEAYTHRAGRRNVEKP